MPNFPALQSLPQAFASEVWPGRLPNFPELHSLPQASASEV
jgi:hypothetical protein